MPAKEPRERALQATVARLSAAAMAHGFELWHQAAGVVLAVPSAASHGSADDLINVLDGFGRGPPEGARSKRRQRDKLTARRRTRNAEAGHVSYLIDTDPPIEVVFIEKLM